MLREKLINQKNRLGIFGMGYIGYTSAAFFASRGIKCIGVDVDKNKVEQINKGIPPNLELEKWIPFDLRQLTNEGLIQATTDYNEVLKKDVNPILIAVPTEKETKPWFEALKDVIKKINRRKDNPLVIIESTLAVGTVDKLVRPYIKNIVVAPRRDWFIDRSKTLENLPRIVGGVNKNVTKEAVEVLSIVCKKLISATYREAELVKAVENAYKHMEYVLAQQLSLAYPKVDIKKVLQLVGTKWNLDTYIPNAFGTGGYCIPLSSHYVLMGADKPNELTLLQKTIETDDKMSKLMAKILKNENLTIGCLGLGYKENIKVHVLSPTVRLLQHFKDKTNIKISDTLYNKDEILRLTRCKSFDFPYGLSSFDVILLMVPHGEYGRVPPKLISKLTEKCKLVFDNTGLWKDVKFKCPYVLMAQKNWLHHFKKSITFKSKDEIQ